MISVYTGAHLARNLSPTTEDALGMLPDALTCTVSRDVDGAFDLAMTYPTQGRNASALAINNWLYCPVGGELTPQYFRIDQLSQDITGVLTVHGQHSSYNSLSILAAPFSTKISASDVSTGFFPWSTALFAAIDQIDTEQVGGFTLIGYTDEMPVNAADYTEPVSLRQAVLDAIKGRDILLRYENFRLMLWQAPAAGTNPMFRIRYGRDMLTFDTSIDATDFYTHVMPYYMVDDQMISHQNDIYPLTGLPAAYSGYNRVKAINLGEYYNGLDIELDLLTMQEIIDNWLADHPWNPFPSEIAVGQIPQENNSFELGNNGRLYYEPTKTVIDANVVSLTYDVITERITDIGVNQRTKDITDTIAGLVRR